MKVLIWHWGRRGGGPRYTLELARALSEGREVKIALSLSRQCEIYRDFEGLGTARFDIDTYHDLASAAWGTVRLPVIRHEFWQFVRREKIDAVVCTMSHLWNVPILFGKPGDIPYLMVLHDAAPHPGEDVFLRYWLLKQEVKRTAGVVTLTGHVRQHLCREYPYPENRTWVIPHGVFPYGKPEAPRVGQTVRLLFFGRLLPYKGLDLLLDACAQVRRQGLDAVLHIAGPGDIAPFADQLAGLDNVVVDNRWIPEEEIAGIFSAADISVLPYREASQSGVIATSFATGVPVIVTPIGGLVEQVGHETNGLVCADASPAAIAASIARMVSDEPLRLRCAAGARYSAEHELSWPAIAGRFVEAIREVVTEGRHGS